MQIEIKEMLDANTVRITTPDERWYQHPKTKEWIPSSTWICYYTPKGDQIMRWIASKGWDEAQAIKEAAGEKGSRVHRAIELLQTGKEIFHTDMFPDSSGQLRELSAEEYEAVMSFVDWAKEFKPKFLESEKTVFNTKEKYAGTLDCIAKINGETYIIDFKTSAQVYLSHEVQLSSYLHCDDVKADKMAILQVGYGKNKKGFKFTEIEDKFNLFLSAKEFWSEENSNKKPKQKDYPKILTLKGIL